VKRATGEETFAQDLYLNARKERLRERERERERETALRESLYFYSLNATKNTSDISRLVCVFLLFLPFFKSA
jgi:hypothetical protein